MIKLSKTSKLDGILSWSLQALDTCQGSKDAQGDLVPACQGCYATTGNYRFANVKKPREFNREDFHRHDWDSDMIKALENSRYFRWFDSGDMFSLELAEKIQKHLPTMVIKQDEFKQDFDKRNYIVSNEKIESLGWQPEYSLDYGIKELIQAYQLLLPFNNRNFTNL